MPHPQPMVLGLSLEGFQKGPLSHGKSHSQHSLFAAFPGKKPSQFDCLLVHKLSMSSTPDASCTRTLFQPRSTSMKAIYRVAVTTRNQCSSLPPGKPAPHRGLCSPPGDRTGAVTVTRDRDSGGPSRDAGQSSGHGKGMPGEEDKGPE